MYRVLLVEDDSQIREVIGDYFGRREKIALDLAQDGNMGLTKILNEEYDLIILDPPAFTKSRETVRNAYRGYKNINARAMRLLGRGGYLVTCSCSHFMTRELFEKMLGEAAEEAGVTLKQISFTQQAKDHPILMNVSETDYLKFYILQVI